MLIIVKDLYKNEARRAPIAVAPVSFERSELRAGYRRV